MPLADGKPSLRVPDSICEAIDVTSASLLEITSKLESIEVSLWGINETNMQVRSTDLAQNK
jgi:hypothetical protein